MDLDDLSGANGGVCYEAFAPLDRRPNDAPWRQHAHRGHRRDRPVDRRNRGGYRDGRHRPGQAGRGGTEVTDAASRRPLFTHPPLPAGGICRPGGSAARDAELDVRLYSCRPSAHPGLRRDHFPPIRGTGANQEPRSPNAQRDRLAGGNRACNRRYARLADCSVLGDGGAQIGTFCIRRVPVGRWDRPRLLPSPHSGPCCQSSLSVGLVKLMRTDRLPGRTYSQASCWRQALLPGMTCRPLCPVGSPWLRKSERAGQTAARGSRGNR
jgi:hypothetical protein